MGGETSADKKQPLHAFDWSSQPTYPITVVRFYVCHICGDLGCGAVSVNVEQRGDYINWSRFGFENNLSDGLGCLDLDKLGDVGSFAFDSNHYETVMRAALEAIHWREPRA